MESCFAQGSKSTYHPEVKSMKESETVKLARWSLMC